MGYLRVKHVLFFLALLCALPLRSASFTSADNIFTIDLPSGWKQIQSDSAHSVLTLQKNTGTIDIKKIDCTTEDCLEEKIHQDLAEVKAKKMTVITNTYTGEEIKQIYFSTGEPLYYISFFTPKNDFSSGYFLMNEHAYSILAKNITYAEADLLFSFFSPVTQSSAQSEIAEMQMDANSPRAYDIAALPQVEETVLEQTFAEEESVQPVSAQAASPAPKTNRLKQGIKKLLHPWKPRSLVSSKMPRYVKKMGRLFDVAFLLLGCFFTVWLVALAVRMIVGVKDLNIPINPNSLYPIFLTRLYGTPAIIFRAKDNQGNVLVSLGNRWHSVCTFMGILCMVGGIMMLAGVSLLEQTRWVTLSSFQSHILYTSGGMFIPLGVFLLGAGMVWSLLARRKYFIFDHQGEKAAIALQKGFYWSKEYYEIYFVRSKDLLKATRKRFVWQRNWQLTDAEDNLLATVNETSLARAIARKCLGHLWGFLRADYTLTGPMDSQGYLQNRHTIFNTSLCNLNKPEALAARDGLVLAVLINMRDMDKWYPWFE